jgi:uncharacterized protein YbjT (DUF2867 family)
MPASSVRPNSEREILVAGATGQQGGVVAQSLLKRGFTVRGLSRDPSKKSGTLDSRIHWHRGDLQDPASLESALQGAHGFFIVTTPFTGGWGSPPDTEGEIRSGKMALDTARKVGTPHVVLSTVIGAGNQSQPTGIPHFDSKMKIEEYARSIKVPITIVRPSFFMENIFQPWTLQSFQSGVVSMPVRPDTKIPMVSIRDIGEAVALAFEHPETSIGTSVDLQGDSKTFPEVVRLVSQRLGTQTQFVEMSDQDALKSYGEDMVRMYRAYDRGFEIDIGDLESKWNIRMTKFDDLLKVTKLPKLD